MVNDDAAENRDEPTGNGRSSFPENGGPRIDIVGWLQESWQVFRAGWGVYMLVSLIFLLVLILAQAIPYIGGLLVTGPMMAGLFLVVADHISGREVKIGRVFGGFAWFVPLFIANLLITLFTSMGLVLLILPGIVIGSWYLFAFLFVIDREMDFWPAMEASRQIAFRDMMGVVIFYVCLAFINLLGAVFFFVGLLVTIPVTSIAIFISYDRLAGARTMLTGVEAGSASS